MNFLNFIYRNGLWISPLLFAVSAAFLVFFIAGLVKLGDKSLLSTLPLREQQQVQFSEAGRVVLNMEGPRLSERFSELSFGLVSSDGLPLEGRTSWLHARRSAMSSFRMEMLSFMIPRPGHYTLYIRNLGASRDTDLEHKVIFTKPHLLQTIGFILGIIVFAGMLIGSVVLFILRYLSRGGNT